MPRPPSEAIRSTFDLPDRAHQAWNTLDAAIVESNGTATDLEQAPTPVVTVAAKIWPRAGFSPTEEWRDLLSAEHGATSESIDVSNPDVAADRINAWVSDETSGLIPQLIGPAFITPETRLVLTDAVYFKAQWATVFGKYGTRPVNFTNLDGSVSRVELMSAPWRPPQPHWGSHSPVGQNPNSS